jgi:hypothetical protein
MSDPSGQPLGEMLGQLTDRKAILLHRVSVAHGRRLVVEALKVDRDAERRSRLVLPAVPAADRSGVIVASRSD